MVRRVYGLDAGRMTWVRFIRAVSLAHAFLLWEQGKAKCPADLPPPAPDAAALGMTGQSAAPATTRPPPGRRPRRRNG